MSAGAIIVAAGFGKRMHSAVAKQYLELKGKSILAHTITAFEKSDIIDYIVVVTGKDEVDLVNKNIIKRYEFKKVSAVIPGGEQRQDSVLKGLNNIMPNTDVILIHDGVRPFVSGDVIKRVYNDALMYGAAVASVPVKNTIKIADSEGFISSTPERQFLYSAQTPQGFKTSIIKEAYKKAYEDGFMGTDDCMLVEKYQCKVKLTMGEYENIKITTPEDMDIALAISERINKK